MDFCKKKKKLDQQYWNIWILEEIQTNLHTDTEHGYCLVESTLTALFASTFSKQIIYDSDYFGSVKQKVKV